MGGACFPSDWRLGSIAILVWQGVTVKGAPNPNASHSDKWVVVPDIGILVFREGLECVLVLAAITASMTGERQSQRRPVAAGAAAAFFATVITWFIAVGVVTDLAESFPALAVQAATGLLAVIVLLVVMNWFFHKIYWGGWIAMHHRRKRKLLERAEEPESSQAGVWWGLWLLGFSSLYREGFEVVLFLQSYHLRMGDRIVLYGALLGSALSGIVAVLTFVAHRR